MGFQSRPPANLEPDSTTVKRLGREAGFDLVRVGPATELTRERSRYLDWIAAGRHGGMRWITPERVRRATDPGSVLPEARSVISVGMSYWGGPRPAEGERRGRIARYAWGSDYHFEMGNRLRAYAERLSALVPGRHRWCVDTGPTMDKMLAVRSGLGWQGKNTNVLTERFGSFVLLGEIMTTLELPPDPPLQQDCGSCRLCLVACPTGALGPEYQIDSRKCISYLTIEHRGPIPVELRPAIGTWVFGCDICQEVCPPSVKPFLESERERRVWAGEVRGVVQRSSDGVEGGHADSLDRLSGFAARSPLLQGRVRPSVDLIWLLSLTHDEYLEAFRGTAIRRAKVWMLRRNAAVSLGNVGDESSLAPLARALSEDEHAIVRSHAAWALGQVSARTFPEHGEKLLRRAWQSETSDEVRAEIELSMNAIAELGRGQDSARR